MLEDLVEGIGQVLPLGTDGVECAVFLIQGQIHATGSLCPHQNATLEGAVVENDAIVCQRHSYRFDWRTGDCLTIGGYGLPVYNAEVHDGAVIVSYWEFDDQG